MPSAGPDQGLEIARVEGDVVQPPEHLSADPDEPENRHDRSSVRRPYPVEDRDVRGGCERADAVFPAAAESGPDLGEDLPAVQQLALGGGPDGPMPIRFGSVRERRERGGTSRRRRPRDLFRPASQSPPRIAASPVGQEAAEITEHLRDRLLAIRLQVAAGMHPVPEPVLDPGAHFRFAPALGHEEPPDEQPERLPAGAVGADPVPLEVVDFGPERGAPEAGIRPACDGRRAGRGRRRAGGLGKRQRQLLARRFGTAVENRADPEQLVPPVHELGPFPPQ